MDSRLISDEMRFFLRIRGEHEILGQSPPGAMLD
jgi:hypothetical protein